MKDSWECTISNWPEFTKGKIYKLNTIGRLVDDKGEVRLEPRLYNTYANKSVQFIKVVPKNLIGGKLL